MRLNNLAIRALTAAVAIPLLLALLFWAPSAAWLGFVVLIAVGGAFELSGLVAAGDRAFASVVGILTGVVCAAPYFWANQPRHLGTLLVAQTLVGLSFVLFRRAPIEKGALYLGWVVAGPLYLGLLLCPFALLRQDPSIDGAAFILLALTLGWLGDTGGYFVGRSLGRHKLFPSVSPNKTVEGLVGTILGAMAGGLLASLWYLPRLPLLHGIALGAIAGVIGTVGDLVESLLKRAVKVKDSGNLVPGHGGLLDRIDSLLFIGPTVYLYVIWFLP